MPLPVSDTLQETGLLPGPWAMGRPPWAPINGEGGVARWWDFERADCGEDDDVFSISDLTEEEKEVLFRDNFLEDCLERLGGEELADRGFCPIGGMALIYQEQEAQNSMEDRISVQECLEGGFIAVDRLTYLRVFGPPELFPEGFDGPAPVGSEKWLSDPEEDRKEAQFYRELLEREERVRDYCGPQCPERVIFYRDLEARADMLEARAEAPREPPPASALLAGSLLAASAPQRL